MQIRPSRGNGRVVGAALSKQAIDKVSSEIEAKIKPGMTWEEAGKEIAPALSGVEQANAYEVLEMLQNMAAKGLKVGTGDEVFQKEAQHWIGRGLNWLADKARGLGDSAKNVGQGVADWGKGQMDTAKQWQAIQPKIQELRTALDYIEKNPASLATMWQNIMTQVQALKPAAPAAPAATTAPAAPNAPGSPPSGQAAPAAKVAPAQPMGMGFGG